MSISWSVKQQISRQTIPHSAACISAGGAVFTRRIKLWAAIQRKSPPAFRGRARLRHPTPSRYAAAAPARAESQPAFSFRNRQLIVISLLSRFRQIIPQVLRRSLLFQQTVPGHLPQQQDRRGLGDAQCRLHVFPDDPPILSAQPDDLLHPGLSLAQTGGWPGRWGIFCLAAEIQVRQGDLEGVVGGLDIIASSEGFLKCSLPKSPPYIARRLRD